MMHDDTHRLSLRHKVFRILDPTARQTTLERGADLAICLLILANVAAVILESVEPVEVRFAPAFYRFELFSVLVFTVEYLLRVWSCVEQQRFAHPLWGRLRFIFTPMALMDLIVILPFYLPRVTVDLRFVRAVRLVRMMRVLKFARYSRALRTFAAVFRAKKPDLVVVTLFLMVMIVIASSFMYLVERSAQPDKFSSIPAAMWWSVATLTTVGYGDIFPITPIGKLLGSIIALIGIGFFALPAGLLASAFADEVARAREGRRTKRCPHCDRELD